VRRGSRDTRTEEIIGQHFSQFYREEDRKPDLPRKALEIAAREGRYEKEGWRVRKDETKFWANVVIDTIRNPDGSLLGLPRSRGYHGTHEGPAKRWTDPRGR